MAEGIFFYLLVLFIYVPWLLYAIKTGKAARFPVIFFCFFGLFIYNALGSFFVIFPELAGRENFFNYEFIGILLIQVIIFYIITYLYFKSVRKPSYKYFPEPKNDWLFLFLLMGLIGLILMSYFQNVGVPTLVEIIAGNLDETNIVAHRVASTYGSDGSQEGSYAFYRLGFTTFTLIAGTYAFVLSLLKNPKKSIIEYLIIASCIVISALPGGKGSIMDIVTALAIAYILFCWGYTPAGRRKIDFTKILAFFGVAFVPVIVLYQLYYGSDVDYNFIFSQILYRIIGVASESIAAAVSYTEKYGFFNGATLPTIRGILSHQQVQAGWEMHMFMFGSRGSVNVSAPVEGFINFGWLGLILFSILTFLSAILVQEAFRYLPKNILSFTLLVVYCVLATKNSQFSVFATFISLTYVFAFLILSIGRGVLSVIFPSKKSVKAY